MLVDKYLNKIEIIYDQSLVTTAFYALHLGLNVKSLDFQRILDRCQHRVISFDITEYLKVRTNH